MTEIWPEVVRIQKAHKWLGKMSSGSPVDWDFLFSSKVQLF
jgi:hypothetical protein